MGDRAPAKMLPSFRELTPLPHSDKEAEAQRRNPVGVEVELTAAPANAQSFLRPG